MVFLLCSALSFSPTVNFLTSIKHASSYGLMTTLFAPMAEHVMRAHWIDNRALSLAIWILSQKNAGRNCKQTTLESSYIRVIKTKPIWSSLSSAPLNLDPRRFSSSARWVVAWIRPSLTLPYSAILSKCHLTSAWTMGWRKSSSAGTRLKSMGEAAILSHSFRGVGLFKVSKRKDFDGH